MDFPQALPAALTPRLGFTFDAVGFARRSAPAQVEIGWRLRELVTGIVADVGCELGETDNDGGCGDAMTVFLPLGTDHARALPDLIQSAVCRLSWNNARHFDQIQLRMAVGCGLVGFGPLGFAGPLVVELKRLIDSTPLRRAVRGCELAVLTSNALYEEVIRPGYLDADRWALRRVRVCSKEYRAPAWLWPGS